jgi:hypothetical protein
MWLLLLVCLSTLCGLGVDVCWDILSVEGISEAVQTMSCLTAIDVSGITTKPVRKGAIDTLMQVITTSAGPRLERLTAEYCPHLSKGVGLSQWALPSRHQLIT